MENMDNSFIQKVKSVAELKYYKNEKYLRDNYTYNLLPLLKETYVNGVREKQIDSLINFTSPIYSKGILPNIYAVGKSGTGKTITTLITLDNIKRLTKQGKNFEYFYINCSECSTTYKALFNLLKKFGYYGNKIERNTASVKYEVERLAKKFKGKVICIILDELDRLNDPNDLLYYLSDSFKHNTGVESFMILITNFASCYKYLDNRVKGRLQCRELIFDPYNAIELKEILKLRAEKALLPKICAEGVIDKCAAFAARDYGNARKALSLLYYSIEIAKELREKIVKEEHVDIAADRLESEKCLSIIRNETTQTLTVFLSIINLLKESNKDYVETAEVYLKYKKICTDGARRSLTQGTVSDILSDLDMLGLIDAKVISKGRYGRTKQISLTLPAQIIVKAEEICKEGLGL